LPHPPTLLSPEELARRTAEAFRVFEQAEKLRAQVRAKDGGYRRGIYL
jgi:hypothetical protein